MQELNREQIKLTDVDTKNEPIAVLIGADVCGKLLTGRRRELACGAVAIETLLGWTLMGKTNVQQEPRPDTALLVVSMITQEANITDLWKLDTLGITDLDVKKTEQVYQTEIKERFRQMIRINDEGRYEVLLPWKENHSRLVGNEKAASRRLESTTKKLRDQNLYDVYQKMFDEWISKGSSKKLTTKK